MLRKIEDEYNPDEMDAAVGMILAANCACDYNQRENTKKKLYDYMRDLVQERIKVYQCSTDDRRKLELEIDKLKRTIRSKDEAVAAADERLKSANEWQAAKDRRINDAGDKLASLHREIRSSLVLRLYFWLKGGKPEGGKS